MNRKQLFNFINEEILPGAEIPEWYWLANGKECFCEILRAVEKWRIGKPINIEMDAKISDGVLCINGESVKRVAPMMTKVAYSTEAIYWEGRILARQERY